MQLSIIIVTLNEERNIRRCLESVKDVANEIIVVDSGSTDSTSSICHEYAATVIDQPWLGMIKQKNFALSKASYDWVLSLDADEALSPMLTSSIKAILKSPAADGYTMNRLTNYCGTWVRHSGWYPDKKLRLFKRSIGQFTGINPHDRLTLKSGLQTKHIQGDILHYSYGSVSEHVHQIDRFSTIAAKSMHQLGRRSSVLKIFYKPVAKFTSHYFIKAGFLDGLTGYIIAVNSAHAVFLKYLRLYYLQNGKTL